MSVGLSGPEEIRATYASPRVASEYVGQRFASELNRLLHDRQVAVLQRVIDRTRPAAVLEIAPGPGRLTRELRVPGRLDCLEYNEGMIAHGRQVCGDHVYWRQGDAFQLPFRQKFDLVYTFRFIRHFHRADRDRLYAQIHRVLRSGGHFLMDAVNEATSRPLREADPKAYPIYDKLYRRDELRDELRAAGFELLELVPVQKSYRWQLCSQVLIGPRANWLNRLLIRGLELIPAGRELEWVVQCRRA
jgi:ubiquinone/menaquinone biosynthesis C-methylase UbiE